MKSRQASSIAKDTNYHTPQKRPPERKTGGQREEINMTYQEYRNKRQEEYNALPIWYAFGQQQFDEAMKAHGLEPEDTDKIYALGHGGYYLRSDAEKVKAFFTEPDGLDELMADADFRKDAFRYEMDNHEYCINWQADWDVCCCFGNCEYSGEKDYTDYLKEMGHPEWIPEYATAKKAHIKWAVENDIL